MTNNFGESWSGEWWKKLNDAMSGASEIIESEGHFEEAEFVFAFSRQKGRDGRFRQFH